MSSSRKLSYFTFSTAKKNSRQKVCALTEKGLRLVSTSSGIEFDSKKIRRLISRDTVDRINFGRRRRPNTDRNIAPRVTLKN